MPSFQDFRQAVRPRSGRVKSPARASATRAVKVLSGMILCSPISLIGAASFGRQNTMPVAEVPVDARDRGRVLVDQPTSVIRP
jgi:hypothetical protein